MPVVLNEFSELKSLQPNSTCFPAVLGRILGEVTAAVAFEFAVFNMATFGGLISHHSTMGCRCELTMALSSLGLSCQKKQIKETFWFFQEK